MVDVLSFDQVQQELVREGFRNIGGREDDKALRFVHRQIKHPVFLKLSKAESPTTREWLVLHPTYANELPAIPGLSRSRAGITHSTAYVDFPPRRHGGQGETPYGIDLGFADPGALSNLLHYLLNKGEPAVPSAEEDIESADDLPVTETERAAVIAARRGQGRFRKSLEAMWKHCAVTGCANPALLRASHIKPWRDSDNHDRLSPYNGLLLSAHVDAAFDRGLISFADDGTILLHGHRLTEADATAIGIHQGMKLAAVHDQHKPYLAEHRRLHHFEK